MKKFIAVMMAAAMGITALAGCSNSSNTENGGNTEERTTFTVGFDQEFPPYGYVDTDGSYTGFDIEAAEEVARRNGWEFVARPINWNAKDMELNSGSIDCIWNGFTMNGREDLYEWTQPYMDNSQVFVTKADSGISTFADLAGKTVTVQVDTPALEALNSEENSELRNSFANLIECPDYNSAFMDLESGAVDAIAMDIGVARYQIEGREDQFVILDEVLLAEEYGVGFKLGNTELRDAVEKTMLEMVEDGTYAELCEKYDLADSFILGASDSGTSEPEQTAAAE